MKLALRLTIIFLIGIYLFSDNQSLQDFVLPGDVVEIDDSVDAEIVRIEKKRLLNKDTIVPLNLKTIELSQKINKTKKSLPHRGQDQHEEKHSHLPSNQLIEAGINIGSLYEQALKDKESKVAVVKFLGECAVNDSLIKSVRGLCLAKRIKLDDTGIDIKSFPKRVQYLALKILKG